MNKCPPDSVNIVSTPWRWSAVIASSPPCGSVTPSHRVKELGQGFDPQFGILELRRVPRVRNDHELGRGKSLRHHRGRVDERCVLLADKDEQWLSERRGERGKIIRLVAE